MSETPPRLAKEMDPAERAEALAAIKRALPAELPPLDVSVKAKDMSDAERREWLAAHRKRFPS
jgi:hypothetical protein